MVGGYLRSSDRYIVLVNQVPATWFAAMVGIRLLTSHSATALHTRGRRYFFRPLVAASRGDVAAGDDQSQALIARIKVRSAFRSCRSAS
jgi:hypothetical protein